MQRTMWYQLLAVGALAAPIVSRAQAPQPKVPAAKVRELATIEGDVSGFVRLPSGRALIYSFRIGVGVDRAADSTFAYDIETKHRTLLGTGMYPGAVSPQGDRFAFFRSSEDRTGSFVWTMPIDPKTGTATGQAQRVSLRPEGSLNANFSPDGKMLAFRSGLPRSDGTWDIIIVPATGGAEHVVANYPDREAFAWAADGKSLYVERGRSQTAAIERVPVAGGRSEPLFPRSALTNHWVVGLSPDARVALFQVNPDRFFYRTASGVEGEISVALPPLDDGWGHDFSLESTRYTTMTKVRNQAVRVLDLTTGQARDLLPGNVATSAPAWSPDGRRLAVLIGNLSHYEIAIMNADGSGQRRYPLPKQLNGWGDPWDMPWSPDGRFLAFRARDRGEVGWNDTERKLVLLDVKSGETRVLATASSSIGNFVWRSDGKAVRAIKYAVAPGYAVAYTWPRTTGSIVEIDVDGTERLLRDISADFPKVNDVAFTSDRAVVVTVTAEKKTERFLVPLDGGSARPLPDPGTEPGLRIGGFLVVGNRLVFALPNARGETQVIKILSTVGDSTRTVRLPFSGYHAFALPDGKQFVAVGKATGDSVYKLFLVPLDGSATRLIGEIPRGMGGRLAPSPDGKLLAYTSDGRYTSKFFEVDFGPAFQAIVKR